MYTSCDFVLLSIGVHSAEFVPHLGKLEGNVVLLQPQLWRRKVQYMMMFLSEMVTLKTSKII